MSVNNTPQQIWDKLKTFKNVVMTLHRGPDGDSLGSTTAFKYALEKNLNTKVHLVSGDPLPEWLATHKLAPEVDFSKDLSEVNWSDYDCLITLDSSSTDMLSAKLAKEFKLPENVFVINIDHHITNTYYGNLNYVTPECSSCGEVLTNFLKEINLSFDSELALRLLTGIASDTGGFRFGIKKPDIFQNAAFLISQGVNYDKDIINPLFYNKTIGGKKFEGLVLSNLQINQKFNCAYSAVSKSDWQNLGIKETETSGASNFIQDIGSVDFVFTLVEDDTEINVSFRSRKGINVSLFAKALGGGGHKAAAGASLYNLPIKDATDKILQTIGEIGIHKDD